MSELIIKGRGVAEDSRNRDRECFANLYVDLLTMLSEFLVGNLRYDYFTWWDRTCAVKKEFPFSTINALDRAPVSSKDINRPRKL